MRIVSVPVSNTLMAFWRLWILPSADLGVIEEELC